MTLNGAFCPLIHSMITLRKYVKKEAKSVILAQVVFTDLHKNIRTFWTGPLNEIIWK